MTSGKNISLNIISRVGVMAFLQLRALIVLPIIAKALGPGAYGIWTQIIITANLLLPVVLLQLPIPIVRYFFSPDKGSRKTFFSCLVLVWLFSAVLGLAGFVFSTQLSVMILGDANLAIYLKWLFIYLFTSSTVNYLLTYYRATDRIKMYSFIEIGRGLLQVGLLSYFILYLKTGIIGSFYSLFVADSLTAAYLLLHLYLKEKMGFHYDADTLDNIKYYLKYSLPLIPHTFFLWIINSSDRYFLLHYHGLAVTGVYNTVYMLGNIIIMFQTAINFVMFPMIAKHWEEKNREIALNYNSKAINLFLLFSIPAAAGMSVLGPNLLTTLATKEFYVPSYIVLLITGGYALTGTDQFVRNVIHLEERTRYLPVIFLSAAVVNIVLNILLIPKFSITGAAVSTAITLLVQLLTVFWFAGRHVTYRLTPSFIMKILSATMVMTGALLMIPHHNLPGIAASIFLGAIVYLFCLTALKTFSLKEDLGWGLFYRK